MDYPEMLQTARCGYDRDACARIHLQLIDDVDQIAAACGRAGAARGEHAAHERSEHGGRTRNGAQLSQRRGLKAACLSAWRTTRVPSCATRNGNLEFIDTWKVGTTKSAAGHRVAA
eukprot:740085-Prymnesium_polylepis.1